MQAETLGALFAREDQGLVVHAVPAPVVMLGASADGQVADARISCETRVRSARSQDMPQPNLGAVRAPFAEQLGEVWDKARMREEPAENVAVRALPAEHASHVQTRGRAISGEGSTIFRVPQLGVGSALKFALVRVDGVVCCLHFFWAQNIPNVEKPIEVEKVFLCSKFPLSSSRT